MVKKSVAATSKRILKAAGVPTSSKNLTTVGAYANTIEKSLKSVLKMVGITSKKNNKK
jgi:hypothetical protein